MRNARERLVHHVCELERLEAAKAAAAEALRDGFQAARDAGYDVATLKVVLRLRKMTPAERKEKRALEAIYLASLGMLEGDPLPDEARRRLDEESAPKPPKKELEPPPGRPSKEGPTAVKKPPGPAEPAAPPPPPPPQQTLPLKDPEEARADDSPEDGLRADRGRPEAAASAARRGAAARRYERDRGGDGATGGDEGGTGPTDGAHAGGHHPDPWGRP